MFENALIFLVVIHYKNSQYTLKEREKQKKWQKKK